MSEDSPVADLDAERRKRARLPPGGDGGHDGGMPPDDLRERVSKIETKLDSLVDWTKELVTKIDGQSTKIVVQSDKISTLSERVATIEGQLKHIPTLWTVLVGQIAAAVAVAGIIIAAFSFGVTFVKAATPPPVALPRDALVPTPLPSGALCSPQDRLAGRC